MVNGIGRMGPLAGLAMAASLGGAGHDLVAEPPSPREEKARQRWRAEQQRLRAEERRARRRRDDEFRERTLRQRISEGKDDRADKYLHSAARRRRQAEQAPTLPQESRR